MGCNVSKTDCLIIIPAHNEEKNIGSVLEEIRRFGIDLDILVVNDGSKDQTEAVVREAGENVITLPFNLGYGGALQTGFKFASAWGYKYVIQFDADGQHNPNNIPDILKWLRTGAYDIVIGSRYLDQSLYKTGLLKKAVISVFRFLIKISTGVKITDPTSGLQGLNNRVFTYYSKLGNYPEDFPDADTLIFMLLSRYRVHEISALMRERYSGKSMHVGFKTAFYPVKLMVSILVVLIREKARIEGAK